MRRQLRKLVEKQHGDVKNHPAQQWEGWCCAYFANKNTDSSRARKVKKSIFTRIVWPVMISTA
jgi:hypothetical protein